MRAGARRRIVVALFIVLVVGISVGVGATTAAIKTNGGDVLQGTLSGLAQVLRLEDPMPPVGPAAQFDIPLDTIQQVWVDFPRVVIETVDRVLVGPFSAFAGIAQLLRIDSLGTSAEIPFAAIQQIAFNGEGFRPLPREWLGQNWLNQRLYVAKKTAAAASSVEQMESTASEAVASTGEDEIIWNGAAATPETTPAASSGELPWWVLLVGLAVLIGVFFLIPSGSSS